VAKPLEVRYRLASQMLADVRAVVEQLGTGIGSMPSADMEATYVVDRRATPLSIPTEMSEQLRAAFNAMARKASAGEAAPTLKRALDELPPDIAGSLPFMLAREPLDEVETMRLKQKEGTRARTGTEDDLPEAAATLPYREMDSEDQTVSDRAMPPPAPTLPMDAPAPAAAHMQMAPMQMQMAAPMPPMHMQMAAPMPPMQMAPPMPPMQMAPTMPPMQMAPPMPPMQVAPMPLAHDTIRPTGRLRVALIMLALLAVLFTLVYLMLEA
jgi:hypothetical protein